jgi:glycosyltransferase involved in cell wall biosynthesis
MSRLATIIPVYNGETFLRETLDSIASQTRPPDRVIVLDNGSTDGTDSLVDGYTRLGDLQRVRHPRTIPVWDNFNCALDYASQVDFLHIMSADDLLEPRFFESLLPHLGSVAGRAMVFSGLRIIDEKGRITRDYAGPRKPHSQRLTRRQFLVRQMELRHVYCQSVVLKTAGLASPVRFKTDWKQAADVLFFSEWSTHCELIIEVKEPLCHYRLHSGNITGGNINRLEAWVTEEWRAMQAVQGLLVEGGMRRFLRRQKLRVILAARSRVKVATIQPLSPDYAHQIGRWTRETVGGFAWRLGGLAVWIRTCYRKLLGWRRSATSSPAVMSWKSSENQLEESAAKAAKRCGK